MEPGRRNDMSRRRYLHSLLIMAVFAMVISLSAVCALAESSVKITKPEKSKNFIKIYTF